jgi:CheY-like chemotaxis protein
VAEEDRPAPPPTRPVRALIVDDNIDAAVCLGMLLDLGGHATRIAHSGPDALKLASEFKPQVIFLDIGMPEMNGYEVAHALRSLREIGHPVLVAVTGWGAPEDRVQSKNAGFDEHLTKPDIAELRFTVIYEFAFSPTIGDIYEKMHPSYSHPGLGRPRLLGSRQSRCRLLQKCR